MDNSGHYYEIMPILVTKASTHKLTKRSNEAIRFEEPYQTYAIFRKTGQNIILGLDYLKPNCKQAFHRSKI